MTDKLLISVAKSLILNVVGGPKYASEYYKYITDL